MRIALRVVLVLVLLALAKWAIDQRFENAVSAGFSHAQCNKVWAHRGRIGTDSENTLGSAINVKEQAVAGLELDLHYNVEQQRFWVVHDDADAQRDGSNDNLETFLEALAPASIGLWLDTKKFGSLAPWEVAAAADHLASLLKKHPTFHPVYVESRNPFYLRLLKQRGIGTSYLISPNARHNALIFWLNVYWMKWSYSWGPFDSLSMDIGRYNEKVAEVFKGVPLLLSTVNDEASITRLAAKPEVAAILTDQQFYDVGRCR